MKTSTKTQPANSQRELLLASARQVLAQVAAWTDCLFGDGARNRLAGLRRFPELDMSKFRRPGSGGCHTEESPLLIFIGRAYDFVSSGEWGGTREDLATLLKDLTPLAYLLRSDTAIVDQMGYPGIDPDATALLLSIWNQLSARLALAHEEPISLQQLAVLAGLAEKTVRMLARATRGGHASSRGDSSVYTYKEGSRTRVSAAEAMRWLSLRPDFKPTRFGSVDLQPRTQLALSTTLQQLRAASKLSIPELIRRCGLPQAAATAYEQLEDGWWQPADIDLEVFDGAALKRLAMSLGAARPAAFVRSVAEVLAPFKIQREIKQAR
jgi:hypothetical protein